ncbi:MAG: Co2+/Mg2+ efflux protein ApaG [Alphaproteobacteria bacterium]|jgi:ApaG protein
MYTETTRSVTVTVETEFLLSHSEPARNRFFWAYHIAIENKGEETVQLINRYWRIIDGAGHVEEVSGPGVVGEQPKLRPGERFQYSSGAPLAVPGGIMSGHYEMMVDSGETFEAAVPAFSLDLPNQSARPN